MVWCELILWTIILWFLFQHLLTLLYSQFIYLSILEKWHYNDNNNMTFCLHRYLSLSRSGLQVGLTAINTCLYTRIDECIVCNKVAHHIAQYPVFSKQCNLPAQIKCWLIFKSKSKSLFITPKNTKVIVTLLVLLQHQRLASWLFTIFIYSVQPMVWTINDNNNISQLDYFTLCFI